MQTIVEEKDGSVIFKTPLGDIREDKPLVYQQNKQLKARWIIRDNVLSFEIENYDPAFLLIIDPAVRLWGTYYGTNMGDNGTTTSIDPSGNVYLGGETGGMSTYLATSGAHQVSWYGASDAFLSKFTSAGARLWSTYYGGPGVIMRNRIQYSIFVITGIVL